MSGNVGHRGRIWFQAMTGQGDPQAGDPGSVLAAAANVGGQTALFVCVIPNPQSRFPCVRDGQVGLEEAYSLASHIWETVKADWEKPQSQKRPIIAIVDVKSQAYGRREETAGIHFAAAVSSDAYASARMAHHPVIALVVGHAFSGGFLTHGYQANRILAFDDPGVVIHAMHKEAAARITRRSVADLEQLGHEIAPLSYDIHDFAKLGILHELLHVENPLEPTSADVATVSRAVVNAIDDARKGPTDLGVRFLSDAAKKSRKAGIEARALMEKQWSQA